MFGWIKSLVTGQQPLTDQQKEKIDVLNRIKLFENADRDDLVRIADSSSFEPMAAGDRIVEKDTEGNTFYMIDSGTVEVVIGDEEKPVDRLEGGDYFGEMALLEDEVRSAHVDCMEDGRLLLLSREGFNEILRGEPQTAVKFLYVLSRTLSRNLREMNRRLQETNND